MAMTQAVLPQFRARRSGVVVNVTSSVTLTPMPLAAVYTASKMAIEGFTASLALELEAFNVRVELVEPGYGSSDFQRVPTRWRWLVSPALDEAIAVSPAGEAGFAPTGRR